MGRRFLPSLTLPARRWINTSPSPPSGLSPPPVSLPPLPLRGFAFATIFPPPRFRSPPPRQFLPPRCRSRQHHLQLAADGDKLPALGDAQVGFFRGAAVDAGGDLVLLAHRQDVVHRFLGR